MHFTLNGENMSAAADSSTRLIDMLREGCGIKSVREGCGVGECGACTVLMNGDPICSCVTPAVQARGCDVTTVEGLETDGELDAIQESFVTNDAIQCGFCTPGMILTAKALLARNPSPSREEIRRSIAGNICRCTGYIPIINAIEAAAARTREENTAPL
ncbi:MAG: (2Fe-2S)-binding protein [Synergistaceae bacterium]|nr:(2Fe-2S)-binding protein [Synergistaceae bacterium]